MRCPFCSKADTRVIDSRLAKEGRVVRRRRECDGCGRRFTTYERVEEILPLVVKKDGRREAFDRGKAVSGLKRACQKRPVGLDEIEGMVESLEHFLQERGEKEVESRVIGEELMAALRELDEVAYVRFASVYRSFKDIEEFMKELKGLLGDRNE
ncbi:MAG: transcriptional repressor NrdR [Deltaproteobacteria bacterium]|nr:transcriptional repressor NrdR [Deltaproteobacteria bacterium]